MARKRKKYITDRDLDILQIMWRHSGSMTASEICRQDDTLTMNTAQAVLRKLLREGFIEVADIVYSGTVLSRSYKTSISEEEFAVRQMTLDYMEYGEKLDKSSLLAAFLDLEPDPDRRVIEINKLEQILDEYKKNITRKEGG